MRIIFIGDICGRSGREALEKHIPTLKETLAPDVLIVNGENAAHGLGITPDMCKKFFEWGVDCITTGNHVWDKREIIPYIQSEKRLIRPANFPSGAYGNGTYELQIADGRKILIANMMTRLFMDPLDCPFQAAEKMLGQYRLGQNVHAIFVDLHGEATSEKMAFSHLCDGRVSGVVGTHTHIPTADYHVMEHGTAYMSDAGMSGDYNSVIGVEKNVPVHTFSKKTPAAKKQPAKGEATLCGVCIDLHDNGLAKNIQPIRMGGILSQTMPE